MMNCKGAHEANVALVTYSYEIFLDCLNITVKSSNPSAMIRTGDFPNADRRSTFIGVNGFYLDLRVKKARINSHCFERLVELILLS
jgi:hypothetical protein